MNPYYAEFLRVHGPGRNWQYINWNQQQWRDYRASLGVGRWDHLSDAQREGFMDWLRALPSLTSVAA